MRKLSRILLILLWILWIGLFIFWGSHYGWSSLGPVITHNKPHGIFGWSFTILFWLSAAHFTYYRLINSK